MVVALDFDGVIRVLPFPFKQFIKYCHPDDALENPVLRPLKRLLFQCFKFIPFMPNIELINQFKDVPIVIISAKRHNLEASIKFLEEHMNVIAIHFRGQLDIYEEDWKLMLCNFYDVTLFFDDRKFVVDYLRKHGINAVEVG